MRVAALFAAIVAGAALAAPAPVLRLEAAPGSVLLPLPDDGAYVYRYRHSIYAVPVVEELRATEVGVRVVRVTSSDRRALEYYRWSDDIAEEGDAFVTEAPDVVLTDVAIRVTRDGQQSIAALGKTVALRERFGETVVRVRPQLASRLLWLVAKGGDGGG